MYEVKGDPLEAEMEMVVAGEELAELREEVGRLKAQVARQASVVARPALAPTISGAKADATPEHKAFVDGYLRKGAETAVERKSVNGGSDAAGGYAVPEAIDAAIDSALKAVSPIRGVANVVKVGTAGYRKLVTTGGTPSGWAGETGDRPETATPTFREIVPPAGELYANPAASQAMLDDAQFDVEAWLADEIAREFGRAEGAAFVNGDGTNKPKGFLSYGTAATGDDVRAFGTLQHVVTGVSGAFPATNPADKLIDMVQALRAPYRQGAVWVMNSATASVIRKFKTTDGAFLWQPSMVEGRPAMLLGYPVIEAEDMPDISSSSLSIAFGNFKAGYLIAERTETQILRDPFTHKPFVHFYATKRVGGGVTNSEAIKLLRFSVS